jgi:Chaperone of endosialidase
MSLNYTTLLGLVEPVTGTESGTWGDDVNKGLTDYLDAAIAGTQTISGTQTAVTLSITNGSSSGNNIAQVGSGSTGSAQFQIINCTGSPASTLTITVPASSRQYIVINATSTNQNVKIVGSGPTTGVTLIAGEKAQVAWNGSDFVKLGTTAAAGGSNTQVQYNSNGVLAGSSNLTFNGTTLTANTLNLTNALGTSYGGTGLTSFTANGVVYASSTSALTTGSALTFDGTNLGLSGTGPRYVNLGSTSTNGQTVAYQVSAPNSDASASVYRIGSGLTADNEWTVYDVTNSQTVDKYIRGSSGFRAFYQNGSEQMRLTSTGLGIGTSSPSSILHVVGSGNPTINLAGSAGGYTSIFNMNAAGGGASKINAVGGTNALILQTNTTDRATLDSSGNLGLGVTPSAWGAGFKAFDIGSAGALYTGGAGQPVLSYNSYYNGGDKYKTTGAYASAYQQFNGQHQFYTAPVGTAGNAISFTQAMTLDASGNLGIGTTSPSTRLHVLSASVDPVLFENSNGGTYNSLILKNDIGSRLAVGIGGSTVGGALQNNAYIGPIDSIALVMQTNNTERARIDSSGNLLVGTTSNPNSRRFLVNQPADQACTDFYVATNTAATPVSIITKQLNSTATSNVLVSFFINYGGTSSGNIVANGANQAAFASSSDSRLKTNIVELAPQLANILALRPVEFDYIESEGGGHQTGFVAQEMEAIYPDSVGERADGMKMISGWSRTEARLVKAIQELKAEFDAYKASHP